MKSYGDSIIVNNKFQLFILTVVESNIHPGFKEPVPKLFRLSSLVFTNMPILYAFTLAAPTTFNVMSSQLIN